MSEPAPPECRRRRPVVAPPAAVVAAPAAVVAAPAVVAGAAVVADDDPLLSLPQAAATSSKPATGREGDLAESGHGYSFCVAVGFGWRGWRDERAVTSRDVGPAADDLPAEEAEEPEDTTPRRRRG